MEKTKKKSPVPRTPRAVAGAVLAMTMGLAACGNSVGTTGAAPSDVTPVRVPAATAESTASQQATTTQPVAPQADTGGRSKADYPYFTAGHLGTSNPSGNNNTSAEFARVVYDQFIDNWIRTGMNNPVLTATSPVSGGTYTMTCSPQSMYVLCTGGNNAKVYILEPIDPSVTRPMDLMYG